MGTAQADRLSRAGTEELGAGGVVEVVGVELAGQGVELGEGGARPRGVVQGDGPVEAGDRRRRQIGGVTYRT